MLSGQEWTANQRKPDKSMYDMGSVTKLKKENYWPIIIKFNIRCF
jgi:hypothetical protein